MFAKCATESQLQREGEAERMPEAQPGRDTASRETRKTQPGTHLRTSNSANPALDRSLETKFRGT